MRLIDAEPIEKKLFLLADKAAAKNPYEKARICAYQRAFEMVLDAPTITLPPNDPLTLEELREMDGEPVWVCAQDGSPGRYVLIDEDLFLSPKAFLAAYGYGNTWLAYRRKPE